MNRAILAVSLLFQGMTVAQEIAPGLTSGPPAPRPHDSVQPLPHGRGSVTGTLAFAQQTNAQTPPASKTSPPIGERPKPEGSMVGYIENAIVGSQVRIRSEAGFGAEFPDRSEFFYAKCGCYQSNLKGSGLPSYDPNAPGPGPGVVTKLNFQQLLMQAEYAPHGRFSLFVEVPVRWIQPTAFVPGFGSFDNRRGLGDVTAGFKAALLASRSHYLTFQLKSYFPTGDASKGAGTNHYSLEPALLYYQALSKRMALESEVGIWHSLGGSAGVVSASNATPHNFAGDVFFYGFGPSYQLIRGEHVRVAPVVELVGWNVREGFETVWLSADTIGVPAIGTNIVNIKIGARASLSGGNSFYIGYGRAVTNAVWYSDLVRFEYRHSFR